MIPAMRELGKKMAAIHATKNETQPAASMVSFRILVERRERNGDVTSTILVSRLRCNALQLQDARVLAFRNLHRSLLQR
jgi:hypothetical protein